MQNLKIKFIPKWTGPILLNCSHVRNKLEKEIHFSALTIQMKNKFALHIETVLFFLDSLCPSPQSFSYVGTGLPGLNQYRLSSALQQKSRDKNVEKVLKKY